MTKALALYEEACSEGDLDACTNAGSAYLRGAGVGADPAKAIRFYRSACDIGFPLACLGVAAAYQDGKPPVPTDPIRALELLEWGCDAGDGGACNNLGSAYENGRGVMSEATKAYGFYRKSCDARSDYGCRNAERMFDAGSGLPPNEAKKRADQIATNRKMEEAHHESSAVFPLRDATGQVADKGCRRLGFDLVQKLPGPHMYEGAVEAVGCGTVGCLAPAVNFVLHTKTHEFNHPGQKSVCVRPEEETWTTVTTVRGLKETRVVLEESLCDCPM